MARARKRPGSRAASGAVHARAGQRTQRAQQGPPVKRRPARPDLERVVGELELHQLELEKQNDELRSARSGLESALQRYRELFDFAPVSYFVIDRAGAIREANLAGARMLGLERRAAIGRPFALFVVPRHRRELDELIRRVLSGEPGPALESRELTMTPRQAEPLEVRVTATVLEEPAPGVLLACEDVTRRKQAEEALRQEGRRKDEFLAALSHELRNPLAPLRNGLFVLERAEPGSQRARDAASIIRRQAHHLTRIVDDLVDTARLARGTIRLERERLELNELARHAAEDHRPLFETRQVQLAVHASGEPLWVDGDPIRLAQVVFNLLGNALKFTSAGASVQLVLRREGAAAQLTVADTGMGIAPEVREQLFKPFRQGPQSLDRRQGGLGLGLAMVKGLVELHGGTVSLASAGIGQGAQFTVRLPLAEPGPAVAAPPPQPSAVRAQRVLVIEDNTDAAESLRIALELIGHSVEVAYDGAAGLELARKAPPEVIICDLGLPTLNGYEVAQLARADEALRGVYLVALSGYALPEDVERSLRAGFDCHVAKPATLESIQQLLGEKPSWASRGFTRGHG
ncbi:hybrid sensor histidine kinase/response regulator [Anaeromyxobacter diazotrophicus]|uniref:histidine kinase n=1 Tax=Anaeromyxobacter diazotrophicus TaxID=2590199 RepID=A0A7I9VGX1_9BACT|nr:ATP-binding protein [Anaeromyxobacter diazotrophicus]GEJ55489.1 hypothetical protein AMYX_02300 [Anaeromyxobacter diazotrophicus]